MRSQCDKYFDKLCDMEKGVKSINEKLALIDDKRSFECIVCCLPCKQLVASSSCQHIIGCSVCVLEDGQMQVPSARWESVI